MIINDKQAQERLNSPMNLINQLKNVTNRSDKRKNAMSLFIKPKTEEKKEELKITFNPFDNKPQAVVSLPQSQTKLDDILENNDSQIKLGLAHDKALELLHRSVEALSTKLDDVKADKLPSVISAASKTVESIRRERAESAKNNKDREVHYHFYTPQQKTISDYEVIDVGAANP